MDYHHQQQQHQERQNSPKVQTSGFDTKHVVTVPTQLAIGKGNWKVSKRMNDDFLFISISRRRALGGGNLGRHMKTWCKRERTFFTYSNLATVLY